MSDVPLGVFLSGGVDSAIVAACASRAVDAPIETFSIGFEHEAYNELPWARIAAERFGTSHHEFLVRADAAALMPDLADQYEEPYADSSALPSWLLARETRRFVTVALNGDGGDEGFAGYTRYARLLRQRSGMRWARRLGAAPLASAASRAGLPPSLARTLDGIAQGGDPDPAVAYAWHVRLFTDREKDVVCRPEFPGRAAGPSSAILSRLAADPRAGSSLLDRMLFVDTMSYLPGDLLPKMDLATMAHGLEARSPLLDSEVLELAASAPPGIKQAPGGSKWILRRAFRSVIPRELLERRKHGFSIPLDAWFRGPLLPVARDLLTTGDTRIGAWLRPKVLARLVDDHATGRIARGHQLWALSMLELWTRRLLEGTAAAPGRREVPRAAAAGELG